MCETALSVHFGNLYIAVGARVGHPLIRTYLHHPIARHKIDRPAVKYGRDQVVVLTGMHIERGSPHDNARFQRLHDEAPAVCLFHHLEPRLALDVHLVFFASIGMDRICYS